MKKRAMFLVGQNQYGVQSQMMGKFADYLEQEHGYEIKRYEFDDLIHYQQGKEEGWDFIFSALGVEFHLFSEADGNIHLIWLVDHPVYHLSRFGAYADRDRVYIGCVDRQHVDYLKEQCGFVNSFFFPHIGWESEKQIFYGERSIDVFFPASYSSEEEIIEENAEWLGDVVGKIVEQIVAYMLKHSEMTLEVGIMNALKSMGYGDYKELAIEMESKVGWYIDARIRRNVRKRVVSELLENGIRLTVCGRNWDRFREGLEVEVAERLEILSEDMQYSEIIDKMADSRIVFNIMPEFKDGTHERVVAGTMNGAVCVTDYSELLTEVYQDGSEIVYYDRECIAETAERIKWLLEHPEEAAVIAAEGQKVARGNFTVEKVIKWMEKSKEFTEKDR